MEQSLYSMYNTPQTGGLLPVFSGSKRHMAGGGFFGTIGRFILPLLKTIGKRALGAASRGATQYLSGSKNLKQAMGDEFKDEAIDLAKTGLDRIMKRRQRGSGISRKKRKVINKTIFDK